MSMQDNELSDRISDITDKCFRHDDVMNMLTELIKDLLKDPFVVLHTPDLGTGEGEFEAHIFLVDVFEEFSMKLNISELILEDLDDDEECWRAWYGFGNYIAEEAFARMKGASR